MNEREAEDAIIAVIAVLREWVKETGGVRGQAVLARKIIAMVRGGKNSVTIPRPLVATHVEDGGHLVLLFRNDEDHETAMKELGCEPG
jgi:hypothetical protein